MLPYGFILCSWFTLISVQLFVLFFIALNAFTNDKIAFKQ